MACRIACDSPLFLWAKERAASCYHGGVSEDHSDGGSIPMLPRELAHGEFSLNQGETRPAVSVWLRVEGGQVVSRSLNRTNIVNGTATTYRAFQNIGVEGASEESKVCVWCGMFVLVLVICLWCARGVVCSWCGVVACVWHGYGMSKVWIWIWHRTRLSNQANKQAKCPHPTNIRPSITCAVFVPRRLWRP